TAVERADPALYDGGRAPDDSGGGRRDFHHLPLADRVSRRAGAADAQGRLTVPAWRIAPGHAGHDLACAITSWRCDHIVAVPPHPGLRHHILTVPSPTGAAIRLWRCSWWLKSSQGWKFAAPTCAGRDVLRHDSAQGAMSCDMALRRARRLAT